MGIARTGGLCYNPFTRGLQGPEPRRGGGPAGSTQTIPLYAYNMGWSTKLIGRSSAVTVLLFLFLMLICGIYFAVMNKWEKEDSK